MKIARIYIRVSTQEQAIEGYSIPAQKEKLIAFCKAKDYIVGDIYIDGGFSGANMERPGLQKLLSDVKSKDTDIVVVYKLDRLSRSQKDTLYLIEDVFLPRDIAFVSMQESFDTSTPFGRAMVGILSVFAQLERENIRERSMMGKEERAKEGLWGGGMDPFGYDYIKEKDMLVPNANAELIKKAYELYLKGYGTPRISKELGGISRSKVRAWLMAPVYAGKIAHAGKIYPGQHEPIVSWETFLQVQEIMERRSRKRGKPVSVNVLAGLVRCKQCGALYGSRKSHKNYYLSCYSRTGYVPEMIKKEGCTNKNWRLDELVKIVEDEVFNLVYDKDYLNKTIQEKNESEFSGDIIKKEIQDLDKKINKIMDLMLDEDLQIDVMKNKLIKLNEKKKQLEILLEENKKTDKSSLIKETTKTINDSWQDLNIEEKNEMLRRLIKVIWIDEDSIEIIWNF
jgi:site-specific DNA recombinase